MSGKAMGSDETYISAEAAAQIHNVHVSRVHAWSRNGLLEAHYPNGRPGGKHFRRTDVLDLLELTENERSGLRRKLPQVALQALLASRRVEKRLNELVQYLGLTQEVLSSEKNDVVLLFVQIQYFLEPPVDRSPEVALQWARRLLGVTEEYLELVAQHLGEPEPWKLYVELARVLAEIHGPSSNARMFIEHARRNLRNAAYFYVRRAKGTHAAARIFPGESYSGKLVQTLFPQ